MKGKTLLALLYSVAAFYSPIFCIGKVLKEVSLKDAKPAEGFFDPQFLSATLLTVDYRPDYDTHIDVAARGIESDGKLSCKLVLDSKKFKVSKSWSPLPIWLRSPKADNEEPSPDFIKNLTFPDGMKSSTDSQIQFSVEFVNGEFRFDSLWQITPHVSVENGIASCEPVTRICPENLLVKEPKGKWSCKKETDWQWIKKLTAVPSLVYQTVQSIAATILTPLDNGELSRKRVTLK